MPRRAAFCVKPLSRSFLVARIDFLEFRIDDVLAGRTASVAGRSRLPARATGSLRGRAIQSFADLGRQLQQAFRRLTDCLRNFRRQNLLCVAMACSASFLRSAVIFVAASFSAFSAL